VSSNSELRAALVIGCHILADAGHEHFQLGHISARAGISGAIWLKASGVGLGAVGEPDFVEFGIEAGPARGARRLHQEWPIHTAIYDARPDVTSVDHTHPLAAAALSASTGKFQYVSQDSLLFPTGVATFADPRLVSTRDRGRALARALGRHDAVILRNHGLVAVGRTPQEAVVLAVSLDRSLQIQGLARSFGTVRPIPGDTANEMIAHFRDHYPGRIEAIWDFLDRRQRAARVGYKLELPGSAVPRAPVMRQVDKGPLKPGNAPVTEAGTSLKDDHVPQVSDEIPRYRERAAELERLLSDAAEPAVVFVANE
jgi:L-fuculose-phosphate aldolase